MRPSGDAPGRTLAKPEKKAPLKQRQRTPLYPPAGSSTTFAVASLP